MTSRRPREANSSFASRRGHASQLSISDPSHHVTEAIGTLYGDEEEETPDHSSRPLSFMPGAGYQEQIHPAPRLDSRYDNHLRQAPRANNSDQPSSLQTQQHQGYFSPHNRDKRTQVLPLRTTSQMNHHGDNAPVSPMSPSPSTSPSLRDVQVDPNGSQFPLTNIENPNDIAQELSNLQALRRMSMDVGNNIDPDLPPLTLSGMPSIAPSGGDDENDPSRLLWVPAKVHPELAPAEFKSFLEKRVNSIKRRSGESLLSADGLTRNTSGLSRNKSTLSHQLDDATMPAEESHGARPLDKHSIKGHRPELSLDELVKDPTSAVQKFAQENSQPLSDGDPEDKPILPMAPGMGLRRSTRTTYRKGGSLRYGDRAPFSKRVAQRQQESDSESGAPGELPEAPKGFGLNRVRTEPITVEDHSRQVHPFFGQGTLSEKASGDTLQHVEHGDETRSGTAAPVRQDQISIRKSHEQDSFSQTPQDSADGHQHLQQQQAYPARFSSQSQPSPQDGPPEPAEHAPRSNKRSGIHSPPTPLSQHQPQRPYQHTSKISASSTANALNDSLAAHSSPFPGGAATSTDTLTFIPTLALDDRKSDKKSKKDQDDDASSTTSSRSWKWFKSSGEDKKKDSAKKSKTKALGEKSQDNARLDVIQNSIDRSASRGRESLVLERDNTENRLQEERKKENNRRSDSKRDRDGSLFSSIFGGKRKEEKEKTTRKVQHLQVPEELVYKPLEPDVDYNWTRFPLLEERAIYRMAHVKLANPRRSLLSQVLLSNFMYSYLAIVQAMHPQMNVPTSPQQKRREEEARRKQQEEDYRQKMGMDDSQSLENYDFDYHRAAVQYAEQGSQEQLDYVDEAQIYEDEHWNEHQEEYNYDGSDGYGHDAKDYYHQYDNSSGRRHDGRGDMW